MAFRRASGFSTAYIGSSNLSKAALVDGVEWNVRLSQVGSPDILEKFSATSDTYWESSVKRSLPRWTTNGCATSTATCGCCSHRPEILKQSLGAFRHEEEKLLPAAEPHLRALIIAALESFCREGELLTLQWTDVSLARDEMTIPR